jgi:hypothetical protein
MVINYFLINPEVIIDIITKSFFKYFIYKLFLKSKGGQVNENN